MNPFCPWSKFCRPLSNHLARSVFRCQRDWHMAFRQKILPLKRILESILKRECDVSKGQDASEFLFVIFVIFVYVCLSDVEKPTTESLNLSYHRSISCWMYQNWAFVNCQRKCSLATGRNDLTMAQRKPKKPWWTGMVNGSDRDPPPQQNPERCGDPAKIHPIGDAKDSNQYNPKT